MAHHNERASSEVPEQLEQASEHTVKQYGTSVMGESLEPDYTAF